MAATTDEILAWLRNVHGHHVPEGTLRRWVSEGNVHQLGTRNGRNLYSLVQSEIMATRRAAFLTNVLTCSEDDDHQVGVLRPGAGQASGRFAVKEPPPC